MKPIIAGKNSEALFELEGRFIKVSRIYWHSSGFFVDERSTRVVRELPTAEIAKTVFEKFRKLTKEAGKKW